MMELTPTAKEPTRKEWWGFWTLLMVQAQNALNEKAAQFLLIPLGVALWQEASNLQYTLGAIIVLPYLFISPFVGWISDRFCKTRVIQSMAFMQIFVLLGMWFSLINHNISGAILWFTVFAVQATVLSPAKKGIVKDMVGEKYIGFASGMVEMSSLLALIVGQIGVFIVFAHLKRNGFGSWECASLPTFVLMLLAIPVSLMTLIVPRYPVYERTPFRWALFYEHFGQIKVLWSDRRLRLSETGISYFWFFATVMLLITLQIAQETSMGDDHYALLGAELMAWLSGGVVVGGVVVSLISHHKVELGTIPMGAFGMTVSCILLSCFEVNSWPFLVSLSLTGISGAFFFVPLNGYLQNTSEDSKRGSIIAAGNFMDMGMGLVAVVFQFLLKILDFSIASQCVIMAVLCFGITVIAFRLIPREFIKLLGIWLIRLFFRPRILNLDKMPEQGGVLLVSNHITLVDALFLTMACPRPIRFVVAEEYIGVRAFGWVLELFNSVPISNRKPREALHVAAEALKEGEVICIFPEGQLTRTGVMSELHRGFEIMAHRARVPVVPVYMDGLWGGMFSYRGKSTFIKTPDQIPLRFTISYGDPMSWDEFNINRVRTSFQRLAAASLMATAETGRAAILHILEKQNNRPLVFWKGGEWCASDLLTAFMENRTPKGDTPGHQWMRLFVGMLSDRDLMARHWLNAQQLVRVNALQPREKLLVYLAVTEPKDMVTAVCWPLLTKTPVHILTDEEAIPEGTMQIVGSVFMRRRLQSLTPLKNKIPFYDFSGEATLPLPNISVRPGLLGKNGEILAISMAKEVYLVDAALSQFGLKYGAHGMLLPGFISSWNTATERTVISGPSLIEPFELPEGMFVEDDNFIMESINA